MKRLLPLWMIVFLLASCAQNQGGLNTSQTDSLSSDEPDYSKMKPMFAEKRMTLREARAEYERECQLKPDQRFLSAIAELDRLLNGSAPGTVEAAFKDKMWQIDYRGSPVGKLPAFPSFEQQFHLLTDFARAASTSATSSAGGLTEVKDPAPTELKEIDDLIVQFWPAHLFKALAKIDSHVKEKGLSNELVKRQAQALSYLCLQSLDSMDGQNAIPARALAALAANELRHPGTLKAELALVNNHMGYRAASMRIASQLPKGDETREYLEKPRSAVQTKTATKRKSKYLRLCIQATTDRDSWFREVSTLSEKEPESALPLLKTFYAASDNAQLPLGCQIMAESIRELSQSTTMKSKILPSDLVWTSERKTASMDWLLGDVLSDFDRQLESRQGSLYSVPISAMTGRCVSTDVGNAYYRGYFYSAIKLLADSYLTQPQAKAICEQFVRSLNVQENSPSYVVEVWFKDKLAGRQETLTKLDLEQDIWKVFDLGPSAALDLLTEYRCFSLYYQAPLAFRKLFKQLLIKVDARPDNLTELASVFCMYAQNLEFAKRTQDAATKEGHPPSFHTEWVYELDLQTFNDERANEVMDNDPQLHLATIDPQKLVELDWICAENPAGAEPHFQQLMQKYPSNFGVLEGYCNCLFRANKFAAASNLVSTWIARNGNNADLQKAKVLLAESLFKQGKFDDTLKALGEDKSTFKSLRLRAESLAELNKLKEARAWAREALFLFPKWPTAIVLSTKLAWRAGDFEGAAKLLQEKKDFFTTVHWQFDIGRGFYDAFKQNKDAGIKAVESMKKHKLDGLNQLGSIASWLDTCGDPELALKVISMAKFPPELEGVWLMRCYRYIAQSDGKKEALNWLRQEVNAQQACTLAPNMYMNGESELLWSLIPEVPPQDPEHVWRFRALSASTDKNLSPDKRKLVSSYFSKGDSFNAALGRYLLGSAPESQIFDRAMSEEEISIAAFYTGWKSLQKGYKPTEDVCWFNVSVNHGDPRRKLETGWSAYWVDTLSIIFAAYALSREKQPLGTIRLEEADWQGKKRPMKLKNAWPAGSSYVLRKI